MNATSPFALTAGRPMNALNFPCAGAVAPRDATVMLVVGAVMRATTRVSLAAAPWRLVRKATQPLPAAAGQEAKLGPANTPPPGAGSPNAATATFDAASAGPSGADSASRTNKLAVRLIPRGWSRFARSKVGATGRQNPPAEPRGGA